MSTKELLKPINAFPHSATPHSWLDEAVKPENLPTLLVDHGNCELNVNMCRLNIFEKHQVLNNIHSAKRWCLVE